VISLDWKKLSLELELRGLALFFQIKSLFLFKAIPLFPCGKRNPHLLKPPLWKFSVFGFFGNSGTNAKLESRTAKKKQVCLNWNWNWKLKANFTMVGVSVKKFDELISLVRRAKSKREKQQRTRQKIGLVIA
jgi:hypothetical protein